MKNVWVLTQFYDCPEFDWPWPVCTAYGDGHFCPGKPSPDSEWALVQMDTTPQHVDAMKEDPRVIYCGMDYDAPPAFMLEVFKDKINPATNYMFIGQVVAALAQSEPAYYR